MDRGQTRGFIVLAGRGLASVNSSPGEHGHFQRDHATRREALRRDTKDFLKLTAKMRLACETENRHDLLVGTAFRDKSPGETALHRPQPRPGSCVRVFFEIALKLAQRD